MNEFLLLKFAHLIAFVYWLGGDLGTFLASRQVVNAENSPAARHVALKIMLACDMGPKLAMPLILPLGLQLSAQMGLLHIGTAGLAAVWALSLYWFGAVLFIFLKEGTPAAQAVARVDLWFRIVVVAALVALAGLALAGREWIGADWVSWKILVFAAMVGCGIAIRINLKPFVPAFADMMANGASDASNQTMTDSIARCRPWVWLIWAGLFINAALGLHLVS